MYDSTSEQQVEGVEADVEPALRCWRFPIPEAVSRTNEVAADEGSFRLVSSVAFQSAFREAPTTRFTDLRPQVWVGRKIGSARRTDPRSTRPRPMMDVRLGPYLSLRHH